MPPKIAAFTAILILSTAYGCGKKSPSSPYVEALAPDGWATAAGKLHSTSGKDLGTVLLAQGPQGVLLRTSVKYLSPGWHSIHLHKIADCSDGEEGFKASGSHINPDGAKHGLLNAEGSEQADLPNIFAHGNGLAVAEIYRPGITLLPSEAASAAGLINVLDDDGFAIVVHEAADDHKSQPIGGAGARVACAAIKAAL